MARKKNDASREHRQQMETNKFDKGKSLGGQFSCHDMRSRNCPPSERSSTNAPVGCGWTVARERLWMSGEGMHVTVV